MFTVPVEFLQGVVNYVKCAEENAALLSKKASTVKVASRDTSVDSKVVDTADLLIKTGSFDESKRAELIEALLDHSKTLDMFKKTAGKSASASFGEPASPSNVKSSDRSEADVAYLNKLGLAHSV